MDALLHPAKLPGTALSLNKLHFNIALKCLKAPNLEKRLFGLSDIKDMISLSLRKQEYLKSLERNEHERKLRQRTACPNELLSASAASTELLVEWLQRERIVELIFGEGLHDQLVRRCVEVLCFLAARNAMDVRLLELVWRASLGKHESVQQTVYSVLVDLSGHLPLHLLDELYSRIQAVQLADYTMHTLSLLRGFSVSAISSPRNTVRPANLSVAWTASREMDGSAADDVNDVTASSSLCA